MDQQQLATVGRIMVVAGMALCACALAIVPGDNHSDTRAVDMGMFGVALMGVGAVFRFVPLPRSIVVGFVAGPVFWMTGCVVFVPVAWVCYFVPPPFGVIAVGGLAAIILYCVFRPLKNSD